MKGADEGAYEAARDLHIPYMICWADWDRWGNKAGPIRNQEMLDRGRPNYALAFHDDLNKSKGTKDMVERLKKAGITTEVHDSAGNVTYVVPQGTPIANPDQTILL